MKVKNSKEIKLSSVDNSVEKVRQAISAASKDLGKSPHEVTKREILNYTSCHSIDTAGGIGRVKAAFFPITEKDLKGIQESNNVKSYIGSLEKSVGQKQLFEQELIKAIDKHIKPLPTPKNNTIIKRKGKKIREVVAMLNDTHYGLNVDPEEIDNLNSFSWLEATRRTAYFVNEVRDYKSYRRNEVKKLHLVLNGDLLAGIIHGLVSKSLELWVHQMNGATHILTHAISNLAQGFDEIEVHCVGGNHEELPHKREGGHRVTQEHYDNFSNAMFYSLSVAFRNYKNISFNIPKTPYIFMDLPGGRALIAHGHNLFSKQLGNPGTNINVKTLTSAIREFNAGEQLKGREPIKLVLFGHTHCYFHFITNDGVEVYGAPSLSGLDGFAHQLTINHNFIGQVVFESTKDFILGDSRLVRLKAADKNTELDKIIPQYKKELKWQNPLLKDKK